MKKILNMFRSKNSITATEGKQQRFLLKTWGELVKEGREFINEDYYNNPEIHLPSCNLYVAVEYKNLAGKVIVSDMKVHNGQVFARYPNSPDLSDWIPVQAIKRRA